MNNFFQKPAEMRVFFDFLSVFSMNEKDPTLWAAVVAWLAAHQPQLYATGMSVGIAALRV